MNSFFSTVKISWVDCESILMKKCKLVAKFKYNYTLNNREAIIQVDYYQIGMKRISYPNIIVVNKFNCVNLMGSGAPKRISKTHVWIRLAGLWRQDLRHSVWSWPSSPTLSPALIPDTMTSISLLHLTLPPCFFLGLSWPGSEYLKPGAKSNLSFFRPWV